MGTIYNSNLIEHPDKKYVSTIVRKSELDLCDGNMEELCQKVISEVKKQMNIKGECLNWTQKTWDDVFTKYSIEHETIAKNILEISSEISPNFQILGNYLYTSAIPELVERAKFVANSINTIV